MYLNWKLELRWNCLWVHFSLCNLIRNELFHVIYRFNALTYTLLTAHSFPSNSFFITIMHYRVLFCLLFPHNISSKIMKKIFIANLNSYQLQSLFLIPARSYFRENQVLHIESCKLEVHLKALPRYQSRLPRQLT